LVSSKPFVTKVFEKTGIMAIMLVLMVVFCITALRELGFLQQAELALYDFFVVSQLRKATTKPPVVLVEITERDIQRLGRWPLTDEMLAELLKQIVGHGPKVIGVDIYRDQYISPGSDDLDRILITNNIVAVEKFGTGKDLRIAPPPALKGSNRVGFSDMVVDADGVVRRGLLFLDDGKDVYFALSLRLALSYLASQGIFPQQGIPDIAHLRLGKVTLRPFESHDGAYIRADARGYQYLLDYRDKTVSFQRLSYTDIVQKKVETNVLEGKIVIVGVVAESVKDYFLAPWHKQKEESPDLSGVALHAAMTSQLLRTALTGDAPISVLDEGAEYAWIFVWTIGGVVTGLIIRSLLWFVLLVSIGLTALFIATFVAFFSGWWLPLVPAAAGWLASASLMVAYISSYENRQRRQVMELFSVHVSEEVAREIWKQRDKFLSGERLEASKTIVTVLFSDLEEFTQVSEKLDPIMLMQWLNSYMERMAELVMEHGGVVDDYYGDAIKANFGVPLKRIRESEFGIDAKGAVNCALAMCEEVRRLNVELQEIELPSIRMRIGICTGEVVAGCLGSARRMKYTTIGDTVNIAARLESYGKETMQNDEDGCICRIMIAESTAQYLEGNIKTEYVGSLPLKGKSEMVSVYCVKDKSERCSPVLPEILSG